MLDFADFCSIFPGKNINRLENTINIKKLLEYAKVISQPFIIHAFYFLKIFIYSFPKTIKNPAGKTVDHQGFR